MNGVFGELKLAVKQLAWLHAVPKPPDKRKKAREGSRLKNLIDKGRRPPVPEVPCQYLVEILFDVGPTMAGGMGPVPISELELLAWQINRRRFLQPWEAQFVRRLSAEFSTMHADAEDQGCPAPWSPDRIAPAEAAAVTQDMRASLRAMGGR